MAITRVNNIVGGDLLYATATLAKDAIPIVSATDAVSVALVDASGNQLVSLGGGSQYSEGDTDASITGNAILFESDTNTNTLSVVSNNTPLPISDAGGSITIDGTVALSGTVVVDGSGVTQPVSIAVAPITPVTGTFYQATQPISAASLPLPASAATSTKQSDGTQKTQVVDSVGNVIGATSNALDVHIKSGSTAGGVEQGSTTLGQAGTLIQGAVTTTAPVYTTAQTSPLSLDTTGALRVNVTAGGAGGGIVTQTSGANLHTVVDSGTITNLTQLNGASIAMGTGVRSAGTQRVTIATDDSVPVTGTFYQATQPVSLASVPSHAVTNAGTFATQTTLVAETTKVIGTVNVASSQTIAVTQPTGTNLHTVVDSGTITNVSQLGGAAIAMGTGVRSAGTQRVTIATDDSVPVTGTFYQATQPVSIASVPSHAVTIVDGGDTTLGAKTDAKSTATDATSITAMQVWKQISASVQALVTLFTSRSKVISTVLNGVTANETSAVFAIGAYTRTLQSYVVGTGAVAATITWYGSNHNNTTYGTLLATQTLSGTTSDSTGVPIDAEWPYVYCVLSGISGTGAAVTATVGA